MKSIWLVQRFQQYFNISSKPYCLYEGTSKEVRAYVNKLNSKATKYTYVVTKLKTVKAA